MFSQFDNAEVEDYFDRLNAQLKKMPAEDRREMHQELRQHLDALAAAHEELGASPSEALRAALDQLGEPNRIGRRLFQEWRKTASPGERQVLPATLTVLFIHVLNIVMGTGAWERLPMPYSYRALFMLGAIFIYVPLIAGVTVRWLFPLGGMRGVIIGHLFVPIFMIASWPPYLSYWFSTLPYALADLQFFLMLNSVWLAVGCAAAFLTGLVRQRKLLPTRWPRLKRASI